MLDFNFLRKELSNVQAAIGKQKKALEEARQQRDLVAAAPVSKSDAVAALYRVIDERAARHERILADAIGNAVRKADPGRVDMRLIALSKPDTAASPESIEGALFAFLGEPIKKAAAEFVNGMAWPSGAIDHDKRLAQLADLDTRIASMERDLASTAREARAAGLNI